MVEQIGLETLQVWQKSMAFAVALQREIISTLPIEEKWSLSTQLRRSAQSIPANIAEGFGRYYYQEGVHFCYIARGSLEETFTHLSLAHQLGYISEITFSKFNGEIQEIRRLLNGYIIYLKKSKRGENEPGNNKQILDAADQYLPDPESDDDH